MNFLLYIIHHIHIIIIHKQKPDVNCMTTEMTSKIGFYIYYEKFWFHTATAINLIFMVSGV